MGARSGVFVIAGLGPRGQTTYLGARERAEMIGSLSVHPGEIAAVCRGSPAGARSLLPLGSLRGSASRPHLGVLFAASTAFVPTPYDSGQGSLWLNRLDTFSVLFGRLNLRE